MLADDAGKAQNTVLIHRRLGLFWRLAVVERFLGALLKLVRLHQSVDARAEVLLLLRREPSVVLLQIRRQLLRAARGQQLFGEVLHPLPALEEGLAVQIILNNAVLDILLVDVEIGGQLELFLLAALPFRKLLDLLVREVLLPLLVRLQLVGEEYLKLIIRNVPQARVELASVDLSVRFPRQPGGRVVSVFTHIVSAPFLIFRYSNTLR